MAGKVQKRRRLSFSLRAFFTIVLLFGVAFGWLGNRLQKAKRQRESVVAVEKLGGRVMYEYQEDNWDVPQGPEWLRNLLGRHFFDKAVRVEFTRSNGPNDDVADISCLSGMDHLRLLFLSGTSVEDISPLADKKELWFLDAGYTNVAELSPLASLPILTHVNLARTSVSDLSPLKGHKLKRIWLRGTNVSDISVLSGMDALVLVDLYQTQVVDVSPLSTATELESLEINFTQVSDITPLINMKKLQFLHVGQTNVAGESVQQLQNALPNCKIEGL